MADVEELSGLRTREISPEALMIAIRSLSPDKPRVHFLTQEYSLHIAWSVIRYPLKHLNIIYRRNASNNYSAPPFLAAFPKNTKGWILLSQVNVPGFHLHGAASWRQAWVTSHSIKFHILEYYQLLTLTICCSNDHWDMMLTMLVMLSLVIIT